MQNGYFSSFLRKINFSELLFFRYYFLGDSLNHVILLIKLINKKKDEINRVLLCMCVFIVLNKRSQNSKKRNKNKKLELIRKFNNKLLQKKT
jgi:hypothetical protein